MKQKYKKLTLIFVILTIVFEAIYGIIRFSFGFDFDRYIIVAIIGVVSTILFVIGLIKENTVLMTIKFVSVIISNVVSFVSQFIVMCDDELWDYTLSIASLLATLADLVWCIALLFVVITLFKAADKSDATTPIAVEQPDNDDRTGMLLEYKSLLDMGAITQEEFDAKKKQLLG